MYILTRKHIIPAVFILCALALQAVAQNTPRIVGTIDSILYERYHRTGTDTQYVKRPDTKWTFTARLNFTGAKIRTEGIDNGMHFQSEMTADYKKTISLGVSYLGISLNLSLNPAKLLGHYRDFEINLNSYGKRFGFDLSYQDARNFTGWHNIEEGERMALPPDILKLKTLNINTYYVFNKRRFSYPAAFGHSYIQQRSAGSFMLAASVQAQQGDVTDDDTFRFRMTNASIGAGYGYNYVPRRGWLFHISALPTFIVYSNTSLTVNDTQSPLQYKFPRVILTGRGAIVKQFGNKFAGISMVYTYSNIGNENILAVYNEKWLARMFFGFRM